MCTSRTENEVQDLSRKLQHLADSETVRALRASQRREERAHWALADGRESNNAETAQTALGRARAIDAGG